MGSPDLKTNLPSKLVSHRVLVLPSLLLILLNQYVYAALISVESNLEAGASPKGGIAVDEEDDRQVPAALAGISNDAAEQRLLYGTGRLCRFRSSLYNSLCSQCC